MDICAACVVEIDSAGPSVVIKEGAENGFEFENIFVRAFEM